MVHVPAKFRENTSMRFWVTVQKLNVTDRRTQGVAISPIPGLRRGGRNKLLSKFENWKIMWWNVPAPKLWCKIYFKMFLSSIDPCILIYGDQGIHLRLQATKQSSFSLVIRIWSYCPEIFVPACGFQIRPPPPPPQDPQIWLFFFIFGFKAFIRSLKATLISKIVHVSSAVPWAFQMLTCSDILWARWLILSNIRLQHDLISLFVNFSCELGQIMTRYDFLSGRQASCFNFRRPGGGAKFVFIERYFRVPLPRCPPPPPPLLIYDNRGMD